MDSDVRDMDDAWREYVVERDASGAKYGWNPKRVFEAGWIAGFRSSGWYSGSE